MHNFDGQAPRANCGADARRPDKRSSWAGISSIQRRPWIEEEIELGKNAQGGKQEAAVPIIRLNNGPARRLATSGRWPLSAPTRAGHRTRQLHPTPPAQSIRCWPASTWPAPDSRGDQRTRRQPTTRPTRRSPRLLPSARLVLGCPGPGGCAEFAGQCRHCFPVECPDTAVGTQPEIGRRLIQSRPEQRVLGAKRSVHRQVRPVGAVVSHRALVCTDRNRRRLIFGCSPNVKQLAGFGHVQVPDLDLRSPPTRAFWKSIPYFFDVFI